MDTRQNEETASPLGGPPDRSRIRPLGPGTIALAVAAVIAVAAAATWALAVDDGGSVGPAATPAPVTSALSPDPAGSGAEPTVYLWDPESGGWTLVHQLQRDPTDADLSRDGGGLVFASEGSGGLSQIYVVEPNGTERQLTDLAGGAFEPTWSPDGRRIAFSARQREGTDSDIYLMNADGGGLRRLFGTHRDDGHPDWSPDGSRIAFHARYDNGVPGGLIWVASVRSGAMAKLTPLHTPFGAIEPAWSPDGRRIAYVRFHRSTLNGQIVSSAIWSMRSDGSDVTRVRQQAGFRKLVKNLSWSPDGRFIIVDELHGGVYIVDPRTSLETRLFSSVVDVIGWGRQGMLVTLTGDPPAAPPPALAVFRPEVGIDASVTLTRSGCALDSPHRLIRPGELKLAFVNASGYRAMFAVVRMAPGQRVEDLRTDPGQSPRDRRFVGARGVETWFTRPNVTGERWAVTCWRDFNPEPNGSFMKPVGVVAMEVANP